jgi:hypothetical protein
MAETHKITINNMAFNPGSLTIKVGDAIEWTNQTGMAHTVNPDKSEFPSSGHIKPQARFLTRSAPPVRPQPLTLRDPSVYEGNGYRHLIRIRGLQRAPRPLLAELLLELEIHHGELVVNYYQPARWRDQLHA